MNRKLVSTGLLAGLVAGTGAGLILQQTGLAGASNGVAAVAVVDDDTATTDTATTDTATTDTSATDDSTTTDTDTDADADSGRPDPGERVRAALQPLVDDGTLTADQLDSVVAAVEAAGPMGGGGPRGHGGPGGRAFGLDTAATALGLTADELRTELEAGSTIAEVATQQNVDVQTVIDALVAEVGTKLSERVAAGDLTQAEADAKLAELTTRITDMVNNGRPERHAAPAADDAAADASAAG